MKSRDEVTGGAYRIFSAWMVARAKKFTEVAKTQSVNPILAPIVAALHHTSNPQDVARLQIEPHLANGHATGFGKLIDERLLPEVFGTTKLSQGYRALTPPYSQSAFNEIDHLVHRSNGIELLSLKTSRWTINLSGAKELNTQFHNLDEYYIKPKSGNYLGIVLGVAVGHEGALGDKYSVAQGGTAGQRQKHGVRDLTHVVKVVAGRDFWAWLNEGEERTQDWILDGALKAADEYRSRPGTVHPDIMWAPSNEVVVELKSGADDGALDWHGLLHRTNG